MQWKRDWPNEFILILISRLYSIIFHLQRGIIPKKKQIFREDGSVVDFSYHPLPDGSHLMSCIDITDTYKVKKMLKELNSKAVKKPSTPSNLTLTPKNIHPILKKVHDQGL